MRLAIPNTNDADGIELRTVDAAARRRVSGPGLRTFAAIADRWGLGERERITLLGAPPRSTYHQWLKTAREERDITLPFDTLLRISAILGVHKALGILFLDENEALVWLKGPHRGVVFGGQSPLEIMLSGTQDGILTVRRHLDAWRGGLHGMPAPESGFAPVRPEDVVFA